ncbi:hypothetical protein QN277_006869 [Acacia crassicarpa]|uniref:Uncharacterized protein n=1 Tax=Acacia crassicarpa TaxID=499986 RepID=A0AAE1ITG2_9FABA|nr:hypothetical protein QN277_006869 [Acacia crassicarpa]
MQRMKKSMNLRQHQLFDHHWIHDHKTGSISKNFRDCVIIIFIRQPLLDTINIEYLKSKLQTLEEKSSEKKI